LGRIGNIKGCFVIKKGVPKKNGSGKGTRQNKGRGGCITTKKTPPKKGR